MRVDKTVITEGWAAGYCFALVSARTSSDEWFELHTFVIAHDPTGRLWLRADNRLCLNRTADFEEAPTK